jgi:hypothetical protein
MPESRCSNSTHQHAGRITFEYALQAAAGAAFGPVQAATGRCVIGCGILRSGWLGGRDRFSSVGRPLRWS